MRTSLYKNYYDENQNLPRKDGIRRKELIASEGIQKQKQRTVVRVGDHVLQRNKKKDDIKGGKMETWSTDAH